MGVEHQAISELIPHAGEMCLLDEVVSWNKERIVCLARNHRSVANPLRDEDHLPAVCGVEYAAQAMALHGALLSERSIGAGFLASVRQLKLHVERLDDAGPDLQVEARRLMGSNEGLVYEFRVSTDGQVLVDGRATVALREKLNR